MKRRHFLAGAGAVLATPALPRSHWELVDLPEELRPREVRLRFKTEPGQIHIIPDFYTLYWTTGKNVAIRYFVGVGRDGLYESGAFYVGAKKEWPSWTPTPSMIKREPDKYARYKDGMPGGPTNPLGARALYLFQPQRGDTFLRIHGTHLPNTIGKDVSNGCARLVNAQIVDLYDRVPLNTAVFLYPKDIFGEGDPPPHRLIS